jgi:hypothetical protein
MIWTAGGLFLWFLTAVIGNYNKHLQIPLLLLLVASFILFSNMSLTHYTGDSVWMLVQFPVLLFPLLFLMECRGGLWNCIVFGTVAVFPVSAGVHLGVGLGFILDRNLPLAVGFVMIGFLPICIFLMDGIPRLVAYLCDWKVADEAGCSNSDLSWGFDDAALEKPHWLFWMSYFTLVPFLTGIAATSFGLAGWIPILVLAAVPPVLKLVEYVRSRQASSDPTWVAKRRLFVAHYFGAGTLLVLQQMSVPLAQFYLDAIFQAGLNDYFTAVLTLFMIAIQFIGFIGLYFVLIAEPTGGGADAYDKVLALSTSANSIFEIYSYDYRYWIFIELFYDFLNSLFMNITTRLNPDVYWVNILLHAFYTYLHVLQKPCMYPIHNWLNIGVGASHLVEDIGVLDSIYGQGKLVRNGAWWLFCAAIPIVAGVVRFVWDKCHDKDKDKSPHDAEWVESRTEVENHVLSYIFYFLVYDTAIGVVFLHVASICNWEQPAMAWLGLYVWVPLLLLAAYVPLGLVIWEFSTDFDWIDIVTGACKAVFCWCVGYQISPEPPN